MKFQQQFLNWQILHWMRVNSQQIKIHLQPPTSTGASEGGSGSGNSTLTALKEPVVLAPDSHCAKHVSSHQQHAKMPAPLKVSTLCQNQNQQQAACVMQAQAPSTYDSVTAPKKSHVQAGRPDRGHDRIAASVTAVERFAQQPYALPTQQQQRRSTRHPLHHVPAPQAHPHQSSSSSPSSSVAGGANAFNGALPLQHQLLMLQVWLHLWALSLFRLNEFLVQMTTVSETLSPATVAALCQVNYLLLAANRCALQSILTLRQTVLLCPGRP